MIENNNYIIILIILVEAAIKRWIHCGHEGSKQQYSGGQWGLNDAQLVVRSSKCCKKLSPHCYTTTTLNRCYRAG